MSNQYGNYPGEDHRPFYQGESNPQAGQPNWNQHYPVQGFQGQQFAGSAPMATPKSWVVTLLLCLFLGCFGIHNFYLGHTGRGIAQLLLYIGGWILTWTLIGAIIGIPVLAAVGFWVLVEFVMIIMRAGVMGRDSRGIPLR